LGETRENSDEILRLREENARLQEKSRNDDNQIGRLEIKVDEKTLKIQDLTGQLANLKVENNNKDNELRQKNEEIERLKR